MMYYLKVHFQGQRVKVFAVIKVPELSIETGYGQWLSFSYYP